MKMRNSLIIFILLVSSKYINGQSFEILNNDGFYKSNLTRAHPNFRNIISNDGWSPKVRISINPLNNKAINFHLSYCTTETWVRHQIGSEQEKDLVGEGFISGAGGGADGTSHNFGLGVGYVFKTWHDRFRFIPAAVLTLRNTRNHSDEAEIAGGKIGPYTYRPFTYAVQGIGVMPSVQLPIQIKLYKGMHLQFEIGYQLGITPFSYNRVEWTLNGVAQPSVRYEAKGTGILYSYGLSYIFNQKKNK